jgi:gliding motility-associated-like protein
MKKSLLIIFFSAFLFFLLPRLYAQSNQTVNNGGATTAVNLGGAGCAYNWVNSSPSIGLPASGTGNIASFKATNTGAAPVTATITATPANSGFAYIVSQLKQLSVINTATNLVIANVPLSYSPFGVAVSPDGKYVYITAPANNDVITIDASTYAVLYNTYTSANYSPQGIAVSPDGNTIYVTNENPDNFAGPGTVDVISATTHTITSTITAGASPLGIAVSPDGSTIYVTNDGSNTVSVINPVAGTITATIIVGENPDAITVSHDGSQLYVSVPDAPVSVINTATNTVVSNITVGLESDAIAISPDDNTVYALNEEEQTVSVIDTKSETVVATVALPGGMSPYGLSVTPDGKELYVVNQNGLISVINTSTNSLLTSVTTLNDALTFGNFITSGVGCNSNPISFNITVNPSAVTPVITTIDASGSISACVGTASASPAVQQFTVSGVGLSAAVTATAPTGFELSLTATGDYSSSLTLNESAGSLNSTTVYVRSAAIAAAGPISGNVMLSSAGAANQQVAVTGTINALPTVNTAGNQIFANGATTTAINFTGTGSAFTWVNDMPGIGLAASGTGNIPSFTATNSTGSPIIATVTVTPIPPDLAYITNVTGNTVTVINTVTNTVTETIPVGTQPIGAAISPDGGTVYVSNYGSNTVSVISAATLKVIATIPVTTPTGLCVSKDGTKLYVSNADANSNTVSVFSIPGYSLITTITVGYDPGGICISPDGTRLYVSCGFTNVVSVINTATNTVITNIPIGTTASAIAISPDGSRVYTTNSGSVNISVINTATNTLIATIPVGTNVDAVCVSADGNSIYVGDGGNTSVLVYDTETFALITTIPVVDGPSGISLSPDGKYFYVIETFSNTVTVIQESTNTVVATVKVGTSPTTLGNFITQSAGCPGISKTFTITVNPTITAVITAGSVTGSILACAGTASASPFVQQFTVSGSGLSAAVTATAPSGFEVSLTAGSGYASSIMLNGSSGSLSNTTVYVRSAASAGTGPISGNVVLSSTGAANQQVAVSAVINALLTVNQVSNQAVADGAATTAINFSGTGSTFTWVNDTPGIGLAASGTGDIASFTAINTGSSPVTATITVMPAPTTGSAYIANSGSNSVSVINIATNTVTATIPVGISPFCVVVNHAGTIAYVGNSGSISVINTATNAVTATIPVDANSMVISPDDSKLYAMNYPNITVINTVNNSLVLNFTYGNILPSSLAISPDGNNLYIAGNTSDDVLVFNTANYTQIADIPTGHNTAVIGLSPDGSRLYVPSSLDNVVVVINTADNSVVSTIPVGFGPLDVVVSNDGSRAYVSNGGFTTVSVINTASNQVISTIPVGGAPAGLSLTADGSALFVVNGVSNNVSVVNTSTNTVTATIAVGSEPNSYGNFIASGPSCGNAISFTITVAPSAVTSVITAGNATGNISACAGTASASPAIQQFTVSGSGLTAAVTATAPTGFELSLTSASGYSSSITLSESSGSLSSTTVYVRSAATAGAGPISGKVLLSSTGAANQQVAVTGVVNALPMIDPVSNQPAANGIATTAIDFTGTANTYTWINDTPGIGLAASGTGDIPSFTAINNTNTAITATITVTPQNGNGCNGSPVEFTIVVNPALASPFLTATGTLTSLTTIYGTPSPAESFTVSGANLTSGILVGPLTGFELSGDGTTYSASPTIANTGNVSSAIVYIRLAASTQVGDYSGDIAIATNGAPGVTVVMPISTVTPAPLTIIANDKTRPFGTANPPLTVTYIGFVNNDGPAQLTALPVITTAATSSSPVGEYPIVADSAASPDYMFTYLAGLLTVTPSLSDLAIPNTFTPNGDGINDTWVIPNLEYYPKSTVNIFNRWGQKLFSSTGYPVPWDGTYQGSQLPTGTYYYQ